MSKLRLLFIKEAQASYISHLDLLRTFQRAFPRTELDIKHSQGYHPHPIISIVLPLPVGQSSDCELLDFEVTQDTDGRGIAEKLNTGMPSRSSMRSTFRIPRPPPPLTALIMTGKPYFSAKALTSSKLSTAPFVPGIMGICAFSAWIRAFTLSPNMIRCSTRGPMKISPSS